MAEINYSPPRGNRVQEVSRQFTGAERMMDDRMTAHITQDLPSLQVGVGSRTAYGWLEEDLKRRSLVTSVLNQERQIAEAQGVRQEMDRRFAQDTEDDAIAITAIKQARNLFNSGEASSIQHANEMIASQYPEININKKWGEYYDQTSKIKDPSARAEMEARAAFNTLKLEDDYATVERFGKAKAEVGEAALLQREVDALNGTGLAARNNIEGEKLREKNYQLADLKHEEDLRNFKMLGSNPNSAQARVAARGSLKNSGVTGINDFSSIGSYAVANPNALKALHDKAWRSSAFETPEEEEVFLGAWKTMGNTQPGTPEFNAAMEVLDDASYRYSEDTRIASERVNGMKNLLEVDEMLGKSYKSINDDLTDILKNTKTGISDLQKPKAMYAKLPQIIQMYEGHVDPEKLKKYEDAAAQLMAGVDGKKKPQDAYAEVQLFARSMASELKGDVAASRSTTAANVAAAKALAKPSGEASDPISKPESENYPRVASDDDFKSLPSGAKFIDPNGNIRTKP